MSGVKLMDEFKRDAVAQVEDRSNPVREVADRLGVSTKSTYIWWFGVAGHSFGQKFLRRS